MTKSYIPLPEKIEFTPHDLILLRNKNLGLRLTDNLQEHKNGGQGDAIPLSQLAGAIDIIRFVVLALQYEKEQAQKTYVSLIKIYKIYSSTDQIEGTCLPNLLLSYGEKCGIPDDRNKINQENKVFLPKKEEELLLDIHQKLDSSLTPVRSFSFDKQSAAVASRAI